MASAQSAAEAARAALGEKEAEVEAALARAAELEAELEDVRERLGEPALLSVVACELFSWGVQGSCYRPCQLGDFTLLKRYT
jgi:hypothetical protein